MSPLFKERVRELFDELAELAPAERDRALAALPAEDAEVALRVRDLLSLGDRPDPAFLVTRRTQATSAVGGSVGWDHRRQEQSAQALSPLLGRYRLDELLGHGGTATVHRALDALTGETVAVKLAHERRQELSFLLRREASAMRLLRLPGVVELIDEGEVDGRPFLVTRLVEGQPFPGAREPGGWSELEPLALSFLAAIGRLHDAGVVHGDIKPGNVLVDEHLAVTLLDLGLTSFARPGDGLALDQAWGTPRYLAPEQLDGEGPSKCTDIYAAGLMLAEALGGRETWVRGGEALRDAEGEPPHVAALLTRLLDPSPHLRPTAREAVQLLRRGSRRRQPVVSLPLLAREPLDRVLEALDSGSSRDIWGEPGSGRTRFLAELASNRRAAGWSVYWLDSGSPRPLVELRRLLVAGSDAIEKPDSTRLLEDLMRVLAPERSLVLVDDAERLDAENLRLLDDLAALVPVVRAFTRARTSAIRLDPLDEHELERIVESPEPIVHLRSRLAQLLFSRTAGLPSAVVELVTEWVAGGWVEWHAERLRPLPGGERLLESGERELHAANAGRELELFHRVGSADGESEQLAATRACLSAAGELAREGWPDRARNLLTTALHHARHLGRHGLELQCLESWTRLAIQENDARAIELVLHEVERSACAPAELRELELLLRAASRVARGDAPRALQLLDSPELAETSCRAHQEWRLAVRLAACPRLEPAEASRTIETALDWAARHEEPELAAVASSWWGWALYAEGRYAEAARAQERCADQATNGTTRMGASLDAACAWLEVHRHDRVESLAAAALSSSSGARRPAAEAKAHWLLRAARYRRREAAEPWIELVAGARLGGLGHACCLIELTEAAFAWRCGKDGLARDFAASAESRWRQQGSELGASLAASLGLACGRGADDAAELVEAARRAPVKVIGLQVLALLALARPDLRADLGALALDGGLSTIEGDQDAVRDLLSPAEAIAALAGRAPKRWR